jgi:hypothetical protein
MAVAPERAQAMFVRDIAPDLHGDAGLVLLEERPGRLEFSAGVAAAARPFDISEVVDPDVVGHPEEDDEPDVTVARSPGPATIFPFGAGRLGRRSAPVYSLLRRWSAPGLKVDFVPAADGTLVELSGSTERTVRDALGRLGSPGHWPATAEDPHD